MSAADELPDAQKCHAWNTFNKVACTREDGHNGAHIHDYGNGHICGWDAADPERSNR